MHLEINANGKIVLREVFGDAADYIENERQKLVEPNFQHWIFSRNYEGTVYVSATPYEDKTELVDMLDVLIDRYGLTVTAGARHMLGAWRRDVLTAREGERASNLIKSLEEQIQTLKQLAKDGCAGCEHLRTNGDISWCEVDGKYLHETPLSPKYGPTDGSCWGQRWYPHEDCKYLRER